MLQICLIARSEPKASQKRARSKPEASQTRARFTEASSKRARGEQEARQNVPGASQKRVRSMPESEPAAPHSTPRAAPKRADPPHDHRERARRDRPNEADAGPPRRGRRPSRWRSIAVPSPLTSNLFLLRPHRKSISHSDFMTIYIYMKFIII